MDTEYAQMHKKDSKRYKAITIRRTNVKALPTSTSFYRNPKKVGEGFPFDYNQNSALHINVPLYISHYSKDRTLGLCQGFILPLDGLKITDLGTGQAMHFRKQFKTGAVCDDNQR